MSDNQSHNDPLVRLDDRPLDFSDTEIHAVASIKNEYLRLPHFLNYHRDLGVDRFFLIDNGSTDGTREYVLEQGDCHLFACDGNFFKSNVKPPLWCNAIRNTFCNGHWCASLDADELLAYPHCEDIGLHKFCEYLDGRGEDAVETLMLDMYGDGPVRSPKYVRGESFIKHFPFFDAELGQETPIEGEHPPVLTFSRFRVRAFWMGEHKRQQPPCITKVGLAKWRPGMNYRVSQHVLTAGRFSDVRGVLLHFKFFPGFFEASSSDLAANQTFQEKSLSEREAYIDAMRRNPDLTLVHSGTARYEGSGKLVDMGWMRSTSDYEAFCLKNSARRTESARERV